MWHQFHATKGSKGVLKLSYNHLTDLDITGCPKDEEEPQSDKNGPPGLEAVQLILSVCRQYIDSVMRHGVPSKKSQLNDGAFL